MLLKPLALLMTALMTALLACLSAMVPGAMPAAAQAQVQEDRGAAADIAAVNALDSNSELLRGAIRRIASNPRDADALTDAGYAALALDDGNAALNFFIRADGLRPNSGRIKLGLAAAHLRTENPFDALRLFDEAVKLGIAERMVAADRGLAFDLLGNFARAQQDYALASSVDRSDSLLVKRAVSLSLSGKASEADALLTPLLRRNVREAWRARAFTLAARGDYDQSLRVTRGFMDIRSAMKFEPFLRRMPDLTPAQQVAAIHFGHFPARGIGRDSAAVRSVAAADSRPNSGGESGRLIPSGKPLGPPPGAADAADAKVVAVQNPPVPAPTVQAPPVQAPSVPAPPVRISVAQSPPIQSAPIQSAPAFDLGAVVSGIEIPESEQRQAFIPVDLSKIKPAGDAKPAPPPPSVKPPPAKPEKKETPADKYPARYWVQIATGQETAFRADMRRFSGKYPALFKAVQAWASPWGQADRLLVGPFDDAKAARKWDADYRKAGGDGFVWQSAGGTVVEKLK